MIFKDAASKYESRKNGFDVNMLSVPDRGVNLGKQMPIDAISSDYGWNLGIKK